jgi:hypothetical protein
MPILTNAMYCPCLYTVETREETRENGDLSAHHGFLCLEVVPDGSI